MSELLGSAAQAAFELKPHKDGTPAVKCQRCGNVVATSRTIAVHACLNLTRHSLSLRAWQEATASQSLGSRGGTPPRCRLCKQFAAAGHVCTLRTLLRTMVVDTMGVTTMPDTYNAALAGSRKRAAADLAAPVLRNYQGVCVSFVLLPNEDLPQRTLTVTYLRPGELLNSALFERQASTGAFVFRRALALTEEPYCDAVCFLRSNPPACPRFLYWGQVVPAVRPGAAQPADEGLSRCTTTVSRGGRDVRGTVDLADFGGVALKLNHTCGERRLVAEAVDGIRAGKGRKVPATVLVPAEGACFVPHTELRWDYAAGCVSPAQELVCTCASPRCTRLLCRYKGRAAHEPVLIYEEEELVGRRLGTPAAWRAFMARVRRPELLSEREEA